MGKTEGWWQGLNADGTAFEVGSGVHRFAIRSFGPRPPRTRRSCTIFDLDPRHSKRNRLSDSSISDLMMYEAAMNLKEVASGLEEGEGQPVPVTSL